MTAEPYDAERLRGLIERIEVVYDNLTPGVIDRADLDGMASTCRQAATALAAQAEEIERLRGALKPFADCCDQIDDSEDDEEWAKFRLLIKDYRAAKSALGARDD